MENKYNLEKAILYDVIRTWNENIMNKCNKPDCNCKDKLLLIRCILSDDQTVSSLGSEYKNKKIKEMFFLIMDNEKKVMPCGHQWYSYYCQEYLKNVKELVVNFL